MNPELEKEMLVIECMEDLKIVAKYKGGIAPEDMVHVCRIMVEKAVKLGKEIKEHE